MRLLTDLNYQDAHEHPINDIADKLRIQSEVSDKTVPL